MVPTLQAGYTFQRSTESKFSFTPQIMVRAIGDRYNHYTNSDYFFEEFEYTFDRPYSLLLRYNLNFRYSKFIGGLNNAGVHVGFQNDRLRVMVTNRGLLNFFQPGSSYNGNLSFRYVFKEKTK